MLPSLHYYFIIALISYLLYDTVISILVSITACFASLSAASLPFTPTRAGTYMNITRTLFHSNIYKSCKMSTIKSCLVTEYFASILKGA